MGKIEKKMKAMTQPFLSPFSSSSLMAILLVITILFSFSSPSLALPPSESFQPRDNFLIDCGADVQSTLPDGRQFKTDPQASSFLNANDEFKINAQDSKLSYPVYKSARIFIQEARYSFHLVQPGFHWVRLHFYPIKNNIFDLQKATFSIFTDAYVLLHSFNVNNTDKPILKEYLINATEPQFTLSFIPLKNSAAFINAIEVVSAPDELISDTATDLFPVGEFSGITAYGLQPVFRVNNGGPLITSSNDTLGRTWESDEPFLTNKNLAKKASVATTAVKFPQHNPAISPLTAPQTVYASVTEMADAGVNQPNFNVSWKFDVDNSFCYLVRLHFCDIVSKGLNQLYFNVYVNGKTAISNFDLSAVTGALSTPYFKDIVVNATLIGEEGLSIQVGPATGVGGSANAIVNGIEVMKMSNSVNSLDGEFGVDGRSISGSNRGTVAAVGFAMMFGAFVGLGAMVVKWHKRPQDWQKRNSFSSWLLPLHAGKAEDETKSSAAAPTSPHVPPAPSTPSDDPPAPAAALAASPAAPPPAAAVVPPRAEVNNATPEMNSIDDHSGTAMFAQFSNLNGR
ncbi:hypothetical protein ACSQ67_024278 [Phaseolus vulgaris]